MFKRLALDAAYLGAALISSPYWLVRMGRVGKLRTDWPARFGAVAPPLAPTTRPRILLHAVSVGEVNAIRLLVDALAAHESGPDVVIAATTDTGVARAKALFEPRHRVVRYPFDLSWSVKRFLRSVKPDVVGLVELEVWPNFTAACAERGIALVVINGRLSPRSFRRYVQARPLVRPSFKRLTRVSAQDNDYAIRFGALGVPRDRIEVGGTMKWDTAEIADTIEGADALAEAMGLDRARPIVVAGSTAPGEETLIADAMPAGAQLVVAPRKPEWFELAAKSMPGAVRRTSSAGRSATDRYVLDTIGELRKAYAFADAVVVGRSFGNLHGSDMMEPVALGKATIVGPRSGDFRETMQALKAGGGVVECEASALRDELARLLASPEERRAMAERGRAVIRSRQGATAFNAKLLLETVGRAKRS